MSRGRIRHPVGDINSLARLGELTQIDAQKRGRFGAPRGRGEWLAVILLALFLAAFLSSPVRAETRTLKLYFIHTKERAEITYKKNGKYLKGGLDQINRFLRDWRRNEPTRMDPRLLDLVWEIYRAVGARDYIHVVSAYRSPATNSMLRKRGKGVAEKSQHMLGKAIDFYIPDVPLSKLRTAALRVQGGGVGYYPTSGSPFIHVDVGNIRHWPRMTRSQLLAVFPDGKTLHVPTDGKPLPGYNQALAAYKSRNGRAETIAVAEAASSRGPRGFLAALFGGGADEAEESSGEIAVVASTLPREGDQARSVPSSGNRRPEPPREVETAGAGAAGPLPGVVTGSAPTPPLPVAEPQAVSDETPETIIAALPSRAIPLPVFAPRPKVDVGSSKAIAAAEQAGANAEPGSPVGATEKTDSPIVLAASAPVPTFRPDPGSQISLPGEVAIAALAAPSRRGEAERAIAEIIAPTESSLPAENILNRDVHEETASQEALLAAALTDERRKALLAVAMGRVMPVEPQPAAIASPDLANTGIPGVPGTVSSGKGSRLMVAGLPPATPREALLKARELDPTIIVTAGPRTTGKGPRPSANDLKPEPKPIVRPAQPDAVRWAFNQDFEIVSSQLGTAPTTAPRFVRIPPETVLKQGFQQDRDAEISANRFTGKAVTFLAVARFPVE
jgi:uncharacterized protein YcbK (DUF882 family)